jgi:hypothetical protein
MRVRAAVLVCLLAVTSALSGCGTENGTTPRSTGAPEPSATDGPVLLEDPPRPPEVVVQLGHVEVTPREGSRCWQHRTGGDEVAGTCVDMVAVDPHTLPILTGTGNATFDFPIAGWTFTATFTEFPDDPRAKRSEKVEVEQPVPGSFAVTAPVTTGDFHVRLSGTGPQGDYNSEFRWRLAAPGELPEVVEWDGEGFAPPVTLDLDGQRVDLQPWTACYGNGCYDGFARKPYADVGQRDTVPFSFPDRGWTFTASFRSGEHDECPRTITVPVRKTSDRTFEVTPAGPAGSWIVDLAGAREGGGDVHTTFSWTTTTDGPLPGPATGSAGVLADHDGELDSYGVEIYVQDLAEAPQDATATVTVTSARGESVTLSPRLARGGCRGSGQLWFRASDDQGRRATQLGAGPFTYDVALTLDGTTYHGLGTWPDDETADIAPHIPLTWTPALPAYEG